MSDLISGLGSITLAISATLLRFVLDVTTPSEHRVVQNARASILPCLGMSLSASDSNLLHAENECRVLRLWGWTVFWPIASGGAIWCNLFAPHEPAKATDSRDPFGYSSCSFGMTRSGRDLPANPPSTRRTRRHDHVWCRDLMRLFPRLIATSAIMQFGIRRYLK